MTVLTQNGILLFCSLFIKSEQVNKGNWEKGKEKAFFFKKMPHQQKESFIFSLKWIDCGILLFDRNMHIFPFNA